MAYEKRFRVVVPVEKGADCALLSWLARESAEKKLAADGLVVAEYTERELSVEDVPPKALKQLGRPLEDFRWFEFSGLGRVNKPLLDWLTAECKWRNAQIKAWVAAERDWKARNA